MGPLGAVSEEVAEAENHQALKRAMPIPAATKRQRELIARPNRNQSWLPGAAVDADVVEVDSVAVTFVAVAEPASTSTTRKAVLEMLRILASLAMTIQTPDVVADEAEAVVAEEASVVVFVATAAVSEEAVEADSVAPEAVEECVAAVEDAAVVAEAAVAVLTTGKAAPKSQREHILCMPK